LYIYLSHPTHPSAALTIVNHKHTQVESLQARDPPSAHSRTPIIDTDFGADLPCISDPSSSSQTSTFPSILISQTFATSHACYAQTITTSSKRTRLHARSSMVVLRRVRSSCVLSLSADRLTEFSVSPKMTHVNNQDQSVLVDTF
jgi:hypothetical protein